MFWYKKKYIAVLTVSFFCSIAYGQRGKNGSLTVTSTIEINEYTTLTTNGAIGNTSITVANSALNTNSRFNKALTPGDLIMIIQMQGASILSGVKDSTWGNITSYNNCGNYELREVLSVPNSTTINLTCPLVNNYIDSANVQVVRIPRYTALTISGGGVITADAWNGQVGGIVAAEVLGTTTINGLINADTLGFRGGQLINMPNAVNFVYDWATISQNAGEKGEGIAGYQSTYNIYGGMYGRGAAADAGGGGDAWNTSGGGGGNGGNISGYNGNGNPDISTPSWASAWNLEYPGFASNVSSGGGRGGYGVGNSGVNPLTAGPGNPLWGYWLRLNTGGKGGRPLDYSTGRLFVGGAGGAGHEDDNDGGAGGNGGGLVYFSCYGIVSGGGQVLSNGAHGGDNISKPDGDGSGGGGAGGTIIINAVGSISGISLSANGGAGGSQIIATSENEGPAGGGSGGYVATSNAIASSVLGGVNGTTNATDMSAFPPDGATMGAAGGTGQVTNFIIIAKNDTIPCNTDKATLMASLSGTVPAGTTIEWHDSITGGTLLGSGATFTTPVITKTTVFYVGPCPGDYRQPDTVFVNGANAQITSPNDSICKGDTALLNGSGGGTYQWSNSQTTSSIKVAPLVTTTYTLTVKSQNCTASGTLTVYVRPMVTGSIHAFPDTLCPYTASILTASGNGGTIIYRWSTGGTYDTVHVSPSVTTVYTVNIYGKCDTIEKTVIIYAVPAPVVVLSDTNSCLHNPVTIHAIANDSTPVTYLWSPGGQTSQSITVPDTGQTLTVTVSDGCITTRSITLSPAIPLIAACCDKLILLGDDTIITAHSLGSGDIKSYSWSPSVKCLNPLCDSVSVSPKVTTTYTVVGTDSLGCEIESIVTIVVEDVCFNFTVPNVFTPTEAGILGLNNVFYIKTQNIDSWSIAIYDRWGVEMFKNTDPTIYWDGKTEGGGQAPAGVYYYIIKGTCQSNTYQRDGFVQLIR